MYHRSLLNDFFNDPFTNDPFFSDPFGFTNAFGVGRVHQQQQTQQPQRHPGTVSIEEVDSEEEEGREEESDEMQVDCDYPQPSQSLPFNNHRSFMSPFSAALQDFGFGMMNNMNISVGQDAPYVANFSSTTISTSGHGAPTYYSSTSSMKRGPGGIVEQQSTSRDSRTGVEEMQIHRQLGNKSRTLHRQRDRYGREQSSESLEGISPDQASQFDEEWMRAASGQNSLVQQPRSVPAIEYTPQSRAVSSQSRPQAPSFRSPDRRSSSSSLDRRRYR